MLSSIADVARVLFWEFSVLGAIRRSAIDTFHRSSFAYFDSFVIGDSLGHVTVMQSYYMALILGGIVLKLIAGIFAFFLTRKLSPAVSNIEEGVFELIICFLF